MSDLLSVPVSGPVARDAARHELAKPEYQHPGPSLATRVLDWIGRQLGRLLSGTGGAHALLLMLLVVLAVGLVFAVRAGAPSGRARRRERVPDDPLAPVAARDHRRIAVQFETDGRYAEALREWLRAAVQTIEERGVLAPRPGRTGAATAREAGPLMPGAAADLAVAMASFDEVWFGGRSAGAADAQRAHTAADAVASARIASNATPSGGIAAPW